MMASRIDTPIGASSLVLVAFALWLAAAAVGKIGATEEFRTALEAHGVVPAVGLGAATWAIPVAELLAAGGSIWLLVTGEPLRRAAVPILIAFGVLACYSVVLAVHPPPEPAGCGCGLSSAPVDSWWPLASRNLLSTLVIGVCWAWPARRNACEGKRVGGSD